MMRVYCDFDGTITNRDSIVFLTERFGGGPDFRYEILRGIKEGEMSVFEAIEQELSSVKAEWEEAAAALKEAVWVDPDFREFVQMCREKNYPVSIVSSGLAPVVEMFAGEFGIPLFAHSVEVRSSGWLYRRIPAHDKEVILSRRCPEGERTVYIGDGTSDVAVIPFVDILFARRGFYLAQHCEEQGIDYIGFNDFAEVRARFQELEAQLRAGEADSRFSSGVVRKGG